MTLQTEFTRQVGIQFPIICGAMYPCSNVELIAAVSNAGGIGIIQPITLMYVFNLDLREGIRCIRKLTDKPIGFNAILEASSQKYLERMDQWIDIALEEGVRFFITALGKPDKVVKKIHAAGGIVYHDVTEEKWALRALDGGVNGLICVNNRAGGHAGQLSARTLANDLLKYGKPLIAAGGLSTKEDLKEMLSLGYSGVQMGTRFIASQECRAHDDYKQAIVNAKEEDIVLTDKISGVPVSIINTPMAQKLGLHASGLSKWLLSHPSLKHWMRLFYMLRSFRILKKSSLEGLSYKDFWQAGKSVKDIHSVQTVAEIFRELTA